jgi:hypothetical protein
VKMVVALLLKKIIATVPVTGSMAIPMMEES